MGKKRTNYDFNAFDEAIKKKAATNTDPKGADPKKKSYDFSSFDKSLKKKDDPYQEHGNGLQDIQDGSKKISDLNQQLESENLGEQLNAAITLKRGELEGNATVLGNQINTDVDLNPKIDPFNQPKQTTIKDLLSAPRKRMESNIEVLNKKIEKDNVTLKNNVDKITSKPTVEKDATNINPIDQTDNAKLEVTSKDYKENLKKIDNGIGKAMNALNSVSKSIVNNLAEVPKGIGIFSKILTDNIGKLGFGPEENKKVEEYATYKFGKSIQNWAEELWPTNPALQGDFLSSVLPSGAGSLVAIALGGVGKEASGVATTLALNVVEKNVYKAAMNEVSKSVFSGEMMVGGFMMGAPEYDQAKAAGATDEEAFHVFINNYLIGQTDAIPLGITLNRINNLTKGGVINILKEGFSGGYREAFQEVFQNFFTNLTAQEYYDKTRELYDGMAQDGAAGFVLGMLLGSAGSISKNLPGGDNKKLTDYIKSKEGELNELGINAPKGDINVKPEEYVKNNDPDGAKPKKGGGKVDKGVGTEQVPGSNSGPGTSIGEEQGTVSTEPKPGTDTNTTEPLVKPEEGEKSTEPIKKTTKKKKGYIPSTKTIESKIQNEETDQSDYIKRQQHSTEDDLSDIGQYNTTSKQKANNVSDEIINKSKEKGVEGVTELWDEFKERHSKGDLPPSLFGPLSAKMSSYFLSKGRSDIVSEIYDYKQKKLRESGLALGSVTSDASPEEAVSRVIAGLESEKNTVLSEDDKKRLKTLKDELVIKSSEIEKLKQDLAEKLKASSASKTSLESRVAKRKETVAKSKEKLNKLKIKPTNDKLNDISNVIGEKLWNTSIDIINTSLDAGTDIVNAIDAAVTHIRNNYSGADFDSDAYKVFIQSTLINEPDLNISEKEIVKKALTDMGASIDNIISTHWTNQDNIGKTISDRLVQEAGLDKKEAEKLSNEIKKAYDNIVKERQVKVLSERLGSEKLPTGKNKKVPKTKFDNMIEDINRGALSDDLFSDLFSDYYGFTAIPNDVKQKLIEYTNQISSLTNFPELKARKINDLQDYMVNQGIDKVNTAQVILDMLYTGALSGPNTQQNALTGAGWTSMMDVLSTAMATPKASVTALKYLFGDAWKNKSTFRQIMKDGFSFLEYRDYQPKGSSSRLRLVNKSPKELLKNKEYLNYFGRMFWYMPVKMYNALIGADQVMTYGLKNFHSYIMAYNQVKNTPGITNKEKLQKANELIWKDKEGEFKERAKKEVEYLKKQGYDIPIGYETRRVDELRDLYTGEELSKRALEKGKEALLMNDPVGSMGVAYRWLTSNTNPREGDTKIQAMGRLSLNALFLIKRVPSNFINASIDYTPYGYIRAVRGSYKTRKGKVKMTPEERKAHLIRASIGTGTALSLAYGMFDWDDEKGIVLDDNFPIRINGSGNGNFWDNLDIEKDYQPWSIQIKYGDKWSKSYSYKYSPLGLMLAPLGMISDDIRLKDFKKKVKKKEEDIPERNLKYLGGTLYSGAIQFSMAQTYQQQLRALTGAVYNINNPEKSVKFLEDIIARPAKTVIAPNFYQEFYKQYKAFNDIPEKAYDGLLEKAVDDIPFLESIIKNDRVDVFGHPVVRKFEFAFVDDAIMENLKENVDYRGGYDEWKFIHKYPELSVGTFRPPKAIPDDLKDDYLEEAGNTFRQVFLRKLDKLEKKANAGDLEEVQYEINLLKSVAQKKAKSRILKMKK